MGVYCLFCLGEVSHPTSSFCSLACRDAYLDTAARECIDWYYDLRHAEDTLDSIENG